MARRNGRKGDFLATDDTTGFTRFGSELRLDYWGNRTAIPLKRNLQEIASPHDDPAPLPFYRGASYEFTPAGIGFALPATVGNTTIPTDVNNAAIQALGLSFDLAIPDMAVGTTLVIR